MKKNLFHKEWSLFLDRDGVLNERIVDGYVTQRDELKIIDNTLSALMICQQFFGWIFVVTNQQCIGKGVCSANTIDDIHLYISNLFQEQGVKIDAVYCCPHLASQNCDCRKPKIGLALQAKNDFPEIEFSKSLMVGDQLSDLMFGKNCNMKTVLVGEHALNPSKEMLKYADYCFENLYNFVENLK